MKFTRRELLETGIAGSIAIGVGDGLIKLSTPLNYRVPSAVAAPEREESARLRLVMDEIIPATDSMPAASEVGGVDYLTRLMSSDREIAEKFRSALAAVEKISRAQLTASFVSLNKEKRLEVLIALEYEDQHSFDSVRDYIYEAYYTNERVWKLVGYHNFPTTDVGPHMSAFDEQLLVNVRKRPKMYREI
jgi:hypothetical protein